MACAGRHWPDSKSYVCVFTVVKSQQCIQQFLTQKRVAVCHKVTFKSDTTNSFHIFILLHIENNKVTNSHVTVVANIVMSTFQRWPKTLFFFLSSSDHSLTFYSTGCRRSWGRSFMNVGRNYLNINIQSRVITALYFGNKEAPYLSAGIYAVFDSKLQRVIPRLQLVIKTEKALLNLKFLPCQLGVIFSTTSSFFIYRVTLNQHGHSYCQC